jgi:ADP-ribosylglycohydrolase
MMVQVAHVQSAITHRDPRCSAGSIVVAGATALALHDGSVDVDAFCRQLAKWAQLYDALMAASLEQLPAWLAQPNSWSLNACGQPIERVVEAGPESRPL